MPAIDREPTPFFPTPTIPVVDAQTEAFQRRNMIAAALSWVGTPYRQLGYTKGPRGAIDCSMLVVAALVEGRVFEPFDPRPYSAVWFLHRGEEKYLAWLDTIGAPTTDPKPGDVATYRIGRCFSHSGIITDRDRIVHAYAGQGRCITSRMDWPDLAKRPVVYYDFWARLRGTP